MSALTIIPTAAPVFSMGDVERVANAIAKGGLFGSKDPYAVLTLCLLAQAEGQHPAVVFRDYHIISGKPAKKADAMLRDFITGGGKIEWHTLDDTCADATFSHPSGGSARISWDAKRVAQAQLGDNAMHKKYPRQMLRARVVSEGVRTIFPGATGGLYVPEEVQTFDEPAERPATIQETEAREPDPREPAPREKLDGKYTSKSVLTAAIRELALKLGKAGTEAEIDALEVEYKDAILQCHRDLPAWWEGDGGDKRGLKGQIEDARAGVGGIYAELIRSMHECQTLKALAGWMDANEAVVDSLNDIDRRRFERERDTFEAGLTAVARRNAG